MWELEMKTIARRGISTEELELMRYAASELKGYPSCLVVDRIKRPVFRWRGHKIEQDLGRNASQIGLSAQV